VRLAAAAVAVASFGRGRGSGTLASLPAGIASGVAVSGAGAACAEDGAKLKSDGLCRSDDAPGMARTKRPGWLGGGAKTPGGGAVAVCNAGIAAGAGACRRELMGDNLCWM